MQPGLVSVTFRPLAPEAIITLAKENRLYAIEWGGDTHVPHGQLEKARLIGNQTRDSGLAVASYGSYFRAGESPTEGLFAEDVIATAKALGAPAIRIWAGKQREDTASPEYRAAVVAEIIEIADRAADANLEIFLEYHDWTLTNTPGSTLRLLEEVDRPNLFTLWQPTNGASYQTCLDTLSQILPHLAHLHVFHWGQGWKDRFPLAEGGERWKGYLEMTRLAPPRSPRYALLEFVRDDDPANLSNDAETLRAWLGITD